MHIGKNRPLVNPVRNWRTFRFLDASNGRLYAAVLIAVLAFSLFLTFSGLEQRSLLDWDEAYYLNIVKTWRAGADWFVFKIFKPAEIAQWKFSDYMLERGGAKNAYAKDGFLGIVFLFSYFSGLRDLTILWVGGFFGVLTVLLVYLIGKESLGKTAGLLSAGILAVSVYHLHYSRSGFPHTTAVFFLYLAALMYIFSYKQRNSGTSGRFLFFSGLSLGYSLTCHYTLFWAVPLFFLFEGAGKILSRGNISFRELAKRFFLLFAGIAIPVFFWGGVSELMRFVLSLSSSSMEAMRGSSGQGVFVSYFDRTLDILGPLIAKVTLKGSVGYNMDEIDPLFYVKLLLLWEGLLMLALLLAGSVHLFYRQLRRPVFTEIVILALFAAPFFFWSFYSWQLARSFVAAVPAMCLIIGSLLGQVVERFCKRERIRAVFVVIILFAFIFQARGRLGKELSYTSGYPSAVRYMKGHLGERHLSSQFTISRFFVGRRNALDISTSFVGTNTASKLKELYNEHGYRYLLLDQMRHAFRDSPIVKAADKSQPVFVVPHSTCANLFENLIADFADRVCHEPEVLKVYDLADIINNIKD